MQCKPLRRAPAEAAGTEVAQYVFTSWHPQCGNGGFSLVTRALTAHLRGSQPITVLKTSGAPVSVRQPHREGKGHTRLNPP